MVLLEILSYRNLLVAFLGNLVRSFHDILALVLERYASSFLFLPRFPVVTIHILPSFRFAARRKAYYVTYLTTVVPVSLSEVLTVIGFRTSVL